MKLILMSLALTASASSASIPKYTELEKSTYSDIPAIPTIAPKGYVCPRKTAILDDDGNPVPKYLLGPSKPVKVLSGIHRYIQRVSDNILMQGPGYGYGYSTGIPLTPVIYQNEPGGAFHTDIITQPGGAGTPILVMPQY